MMKKINTGIYIHIPFCESRCHYCDFCSSIINEENVKKYFEYLQKEIDLYKDILKNRVIDSIFIGGGTPSSVDEKYIGEILEKLNNFEISKDAEISIESNPNSLSLKKLRAYKSFGINRISIGAQSFNDDILKDIGRVHNKSQILKAVENVNAAGIKNFNLDLMLALPNQKMEDIYESIEEVKKLKSTHISYYSLILEEGTVLYDRYKNNDKAFADEKKDREMYHYVVNSLEALGYKQYEISNFAKEGYECRHNLKYWKLKDYISFGLSASSNISNTRYTNYYNFLDYYEKIDENKKPIGFKEDLSIDDRLNEFIIMGIRLNEGINVNEINERFNIDFEKKYRSAIKKNIESGLLEKKDDNYKLTTLGRDLSNSVELDFFI
ncbi:MAG: radical SAM family heme chaperone HemW [Peptoniphilus sp.]|jgi:oxygen-independent coproporphyrinogen-3 oxidase